MLKIKNIHFAHILREDVCKFVFEHPLDNTDALL